MLITSAKTVTGKIVNVIRHGHTIYGNPTMSVQLKIEKVDDIAAESGAMVTIRIQNNSSIVYGIENPEFRNNSHTFKLTSAGRISGYVRN